ncbi:MAG: AEC family transporter [Oribacterium sp.]|nr:AEC family transporter [Oribacterium sp.]MDY6306995.1 AEC family transporter [Oribacterium sp.]MDY6317579.1 AEC family transporter [Oribacterium sp.]
MESFLIAVNAVVPFILYMAYGYLFRHLGYGDDVFYKRLNALVFRAFFPLLMFNNLYTANLDFQSNARLVGFFLILLLSIILMTTILVPRFLKDPRRIPVMNQSVWRSNTLMFAYPLAVTMYGDEAGALASIIIASMVPVYNVVAVCLFTYYSHDQNTHVNIKKLVRDIITNPLIVGALVGALFKFLGIHLPGAVEKPITAFASMTTPVAIFILGATLELPEIKKNLPYIFSALSLKLIIVPAIVIAVAYTFGLRKQELFLCFILYATPVANAAYAMAENMGGDGELQGQILAFSSVLSIVTLFFWIMGAHQVGLF